MLHIARCFQTIRPHDPNAVGIGFRIESPKFHASPRKMHRTPCRRQAAGSYPTGIRQPRRNIALRPDCMTQSVRPVRKALQSLDSKQSEVFRKALEAPHKPSFVLIFFIVFLLVASTSRFFYFSFLFGFPVPNFAIRGDRWFFFLNLLISLLQTLNGSS